jgi:hypothetical protein
MPLKVMDASSGKCTPTIPPSNNSDTIRGSLRSSQSWDLLSGIAKLCMIWFRVLLSVLIFSSLIGEMSYLEDYQESITR